MDIAPRAWHIYTLADPRSGAIRYVGWSLNPRQRLNAHVWRARHGGVYKYHWIAQLLALGLRPSLAVVESGDGDYAEAERRWIAHYRALGCRLTNLTDGGDGAPGHRPSAAARAKMSVAHRGKRLAPESAAKIAAALKGRKHSPEHRANSTAARKGRVPTAAIIAAAAANRGRQQTPDHIAKRTQPLVGKPKTAQRTLTPEQVRAIRMAQGVLSQRELARRYGVGATAIFKIQHRLHYSEIPD